VEPTRPPSETVERPSERTAPVFIAHDGAGTRLWVAADLDSDVRKLGLDDKRRFDRLIDALAPDRSRAAGRAATREIAAGALRVHVKRALKGGVLAPLFIGRVPVWRRVGNELHVAAALSARGAPVPRPVFAAGRLGPLGWRAMLGSECVAGALDGATALEQALGDAASARGPAAAPDDRAEAVAPPFDVGTVLRTFGRTIRAFHEAGGWHADLAITNLLYVPADRRAWIVDLQGGRAGAPPPRRRRQHELARLRRSIERRPAIQAALGSGWKALIEAYEEAATAEASRAASAPADGPSGDAQRASR
jgi:3-deoxy-D-manno-octulosonic acid kinase